MLRSALAGSAVLALAASAAAEAPPPFEPAPWPTKGAASLDPARVECGYLVVPESRARLQGRSLRLAVARLKSRAEVPAPDPVIFLHGGPGGNALSAVERWLEHPLLEQRDLILLDQRGTGHSQPVLCPDLALHDFRILAENHTPDSEQRARIAAALECRDALSEAGIDLGAYNSDASAADVADLRRALGYEAWNLYGVSYGTKLALTTLRDRPEGVRSVVLDSAYPPGIPGSVDFAEFARALDVLIGGCAADPRCREAYPDLERKLYETLEQLEADPLVLPVADHEVVPSGRYVVNSQDLAISIHQALYDYQVIAVLPLILRIERERDTELLLPLMDFAVERATSINRGVYHAVECYERGPFMQAPGPARGRFARLRPYLVFFDVDRAICAQWSDVTAGPEEARPVVSDVPTLILAGQYDPITPPEWGRLAGETLSASHYLEFPGVGHRASFSGECASGILLAFLDDPARPPDASCIGEMGPPAFVTAFRREPGVYRLAKALFLERRRGAIAALGALALALLTGAAGVRRLRGRARAAGPTERRGRLLVGSAAALALIFIVGLLGAMALAARANPNLLGFGVPRAAAPLFWLPPLVALLAAAGVVVLVPAWRGARPSARLHYAVALAGCAGFLLWCFTLGFF
jgi:pimeloyl-ACP methyl ester carboxylesterase